MERCIEQQHDNHESKEQRSGQKLEKEKIIILCQKDIIVLLYYSVNHLVPYLLAVMELVVLVVVRTHNEERPGSLWRRGAQMSWTFWRKLGDKHRRAVRQLLFSD